MAVQSSCLHRLPCDPNTCSPVLSGVLLALLAGGCGEPSLEELDSSEQVGSESSRLTRDDDFSPQGLGTNGLGTNGLGTNGLGTNGLGTNGLGTSGLSSSTFIDWFNQDPILLDMVMKYIVACAVEAGDRLTWVNPTTSTQHTWHGQLGLAPGWASGAPATEVEQQIITACLAAHTNKYGLRVPFSIQGLDAMGVPIPVGSLELVTFAKKEACFFGNLFRDEGVFAGNDSFWPSTHSSVRACGLETPGAPEQCLPIHHVERCADLCMPDSQGNYFLSCTYNGKSYRPMTTRIRALDIYICGDGVCQISESCGTGLTPGNCMDCGPCL